VLWVLNIRIKENAMFVHEYIAYSEQLNEEQILTADSKLTAEIAVSELNETTDAKWVLLTRIATRAE
jgi:hypothetical protein